MRRKFALIFMLDTKEHIIVRLMGTLLIKLLKLFIELNSGIFEVILFHANWVENSFIQSGVNISFAEKLGLVEGLIDEFDLDILFGAEILLDLLLSLIPHIIFDAEVET